MKLSRPPEKRQIDVNVARLRVVFHQLGECSFGFGCAIERELCVALTQARFHIRAPRELARSNVGLAAAPTARRVAAHARSLSDDDRRT